MQQEIAKNRGVELSFERIRKLRKAASAFPPGRRRPAVSLEGHLEAGTPEVLDAFINSAAGTPLTCSYIRQLKHPSEKVEQDQQKAERRQQKDDQRTALQNICRQLEREREEREQRYLDLCRSVGKSPNRFRRRCHQRTNRHSPSPKILSERFDLLMARGFDPAGLKKAIADFVDTVLAPQQ